MKARVKSTGEVVDVRPERDGYFVDDENNNVYKFEDLDFTYKEENQLLSEKRANAVYYRLIAYGVDESRLFPEGKGMSDYDKASEQKVIIVRIER